MVYKYTTKSFKVIDQKKSASPFKFYIKITIGKSAKWDLVISFDLWGPIDKRSTCLNYICPILPYLAFLALFGRVTERAKYGQVRCPWKDLAKCSSDLL